MYYSINDNFNRINSTLNNIRQTQNLILDQLHELNTNTNSNNTLGSGLTGFSNSHLRNRYPTTPRTFTPQYFTPYTPPTTPPTNFNTPTSTTSVPTTTSFHPPTVAPTTSNNSNRQTSIEISMVDPRNPEHSILSNLFGNLLNPTTETNELTFNDIITNTEIDLNVSNTNEMCSICRLNIEENNIVRKIQKCKHVFHQACLDNWLKNHTTCPNCRQDIRITEPTETTETTENNDTNL